MKEKIKAAAADAVGILRSNIHTMGDQFWESNSMNQHYLVSDNVEWTTGFCTGQHWLAYELTQDILFHETALSQVDSFLNRVEQKIDINHHDMGFLYTPSCVAAYKITGSETGKKAALLGADWLMTRFQEKGQFIQAWGSLGAADNYRLIIDCLMNLPLLYWASDITGNPAYRDIAERHTATSLANLIRSDNSTYHTYFFEPNTGAPLYGVTHQGYRDGSAWARGQAWGIYGTALAYRYTKKEEGIKLFRKVTDFFVKGLPEDNVPYWDLEFRDGDGEPKDSSAAAIAICGILEMCKYLSKEEASYYHGIADNMLEALLDHYRVKDIKVSNGLLLHGVYAKSSPYNPIPTDRGVDECNTWGDYFYLEALARNLLDWDTYW